MRKFIIVFLLGFILSPSAIFSAGLDQRCWQRAACEAARIRIIGSDSEAKDGFVSAEEDSSVAQACPNKVLDDTGTASGKDVGFCLPVGQTVTRISFGGTNKFLNIGEFIKFMYRYSMWAATILAVMLVIISGVQWTASGGNSDMIGSAKKRIAGAVSGLVLLAFAYTVLNTINPFLVNLRLPQSWLINEQGMAPPFCAQLKGSKMLAYYKESKEIVNDEKHNLLINAAEKIGYKIQSDVNKITKREKVDQFPACGYDYFVDKTGGLSCRGSLCQVGSTCSTVAFGKNKKEADDVVSNPTCHIGDLIIRLRLDDLKQMIYANLDSGLANTLILNAVNHPDWLDHGEGPGNNMNLYYGCYGFDGVFPIELDWDINSWFLGWDIRNPEENNSLKDTQFSQYILRFKAGHYDWTKQSDNNHNKICPDNKPPTSVWVRIEIDMAGLTETDSYLFIGETSNGQALLGKWNDVAENPIRMDEIEKTGVFLDGIVSGGVIKNSLDAKHSKPAVHGTPMEIQAQYGTSMLPTVAP